MKPCVKWMEPFYDAVMADSANLFLPELDDQYKPAYGLRHLSVNITSDDSHIIQTHTTTLAIFVSVFWESQSPNTMVLIILRLILIPGGRPRQTRNAHPAGHPQQSTNNGRRRGEEEATVHSCRPDDQHRERQRH